MSFMSDRRASSAMRWCSARVLSRLALLTVATILLQIAYRVSFSDMTLTADSKTERRPPSVYTHLSQLPQIADNQEVSPLPRSVSGSPAASAVPSDGSGEAADDSSPAGQRQPGAGGGGSPAQEALSEASPRVAAAVRELSRLLRAEAGRMAAPPPGYSGRPVAEDQVRKVLIVSTWRSGSTFFGELVASQPLAFYVYEPLNKHPSLRGADGDRAEYLSQLLRCNYTGLRGLPREDVGFSYQSGTGAMRRVCQRFGGVCSDWRFLSAACALHAVRVVKTVRVRLRQVAPLLRAEPNLRLVLLVRDPRGVMHSRRRASWCSKKCASPAMLCAWLEENMQLEPELERRFPGRVLSVQYEPLAANVALAARQLFAALEAPLGENTVRFLLRNTGQQSLVSAELADLAPARVGRQLHTVSVRSRGTSSGQKAVAWRRTMPFQEVLDMQTQCSKVLGLMKHRVFDSEAELRDLSVALEI